MKLTLLDMVQNILSSMDSDEVNNISATAESRQVAEVVKTAYFNIISRANLPEHCTLFSLLASGAEAQPVLMKRPENVARIDWIKYNIATDDNIVLEPEYEYVSIVSVDQFLNRVHKFNPDEDNVRVFTFDEYRFNYYVDRRPEFCTIIKDEFIIFDGHNSDLESTLQESKTLCYGRITPSFSMTDTFIPDLDDHLFPLLLSEAKATAFIEMKQLENARAERESRRQWNASQKHKHLHTLSNFKQLPNFGRRKR